MIISALLLLFSIFSSRQVSRLAEDALSKDTTDKKLKILIFEDFLLDDWLVQILVYLESKPLFVAAHFLSLYCRHPEYHIVPLGGKLVLDFDQF